MLKGLRTPLGFAIEFLTIIPLPGRFELLDDKDVAKSAAYFPIVGLLIGACLWGCWVLLSKYLPSDVLRLLIVILLVLITGGLHLDAIADTFDAVAARKTVAEKLLIMKSSTVGPFGVGAIVFCIMLKYLLLKQPLTISTYPLLLFPVVGRATCVYAMYTGSSASKEGLGRLFIDNTTLGVFMASLLMTVLITAGSDIRWLLNLLACYAFTHLGVLTSQKLLGGLNGDVLGALIELNEILFLLILNINMV
ncbi:MAG: adenosylcobinamide-GDP ribazoletransferase [Nitrospirae bacterium]|nr:adenosylcobinamide-GDP ribazoletransferase [Nitrospirota bacterium]